MEIIEFKNYINNLEDYLKLDNKTVLVVGDKTYCLQGLYSLLNEEYCINNNIEILKTRHFGGAIINFPEDICIGNFQSRTNNFGSSIMDRLIQFFIDKGLNAILQDNDILIDGYKCASYMTTNIKGTLYTAIHISIGMDLDLIKNICTKPMNKIPKGLLDFGITRDEIKKFIILAVEDFYDNNTIN